MPPRKRRFANDTNNNIFAEMSFLMLFDDALNSPGGALRQVIYRREYVMDASAIDAPVLSAFFTNTVGVLLQIPL